MRFFISYMMSFLLVVPSVSFGGLRANVEVAEVAAKELAGNARLAEMAGEYLPKRMEELGVGSVKHGFNSGGDYFLSLMGKNGKLLHLFHMPKSTPEVLASFRPSRLSSALKKAPGALLRGGLHTTGVLLSPLKRFPIEAFTFFMALGVVATQDLVLNYNSNPGAYEQFLEGQKDPISQLGFAAFMAGNHASTQPLAAILSPKLHSLLPYLGMSVGMMSSRVFSEVAHFPGLVNCAIHHVPAECDKAYEAWIKFSFKEKGLEMVPGIVSMMASTFIMAFGTDVLKIAAKLTVAGAKISAAAVSRVLGVNIALSFTPTGWAVKGIQVLFWGEQVLELAGFIDMSEFIEVPLTYVWNNWMMLGPKLNEEGTTLSDAARTGNFKGVNESLIKYSELMDKWRENNSIKTMTAHNKWLGYLGNLSAQYNSSKRFYSDFLADVWAVKYHPTLADHPNIFQAYPLFGVNSSDGQAVVPSKYITLQKPVEDDQIETLNARAKTMEQNMSAHKAWYDQLKDPEKFLWWDIHNAFASKDTHKMAMALIRINQILGLTSPNPETLPVHREPLAFEVFYSQGMIDYLKSLRKAIGNPEPLLSKGKGYLRALDGVYKGDGLVNPFSKVFGFTPVPTIPEAMIAQMFAGPTTNQSLVGSTVTGFNANFYPPRVIKSTEPLRDLGTANFKVDALHDNDIFNMEFTFNQNPWQHPAPEKNLYKNLIEKEIDPSILGDSRGSNVVAWWTAKVEPKFIQAWIDYEKKYREIVIGLFVDLWKTEKEASNPTNLSNGIIRSTEQEIALYLSILERLSPDQAAFLKFKNELGVAGAKMKNLLKSIQLTTKQGRSAKGNLVLVSRLSNADLDSVAKEINDKLSEFAKQLVAQKENSHEEKKQILNTLTGNLNKAYGALVTYGKIVNAASYKERFMEKAEEGTEWVPQAGKVTEKDLKTRLGAQKD